MARARRQSPRKPSGGIPHRDRGNRGKDSWDMRGTVSWPTMADGSSWTAEVTRVSHADPDGAVGTIHTPELVGLIWTAVVDWDPEGRHAAISARHPLDNLLPA